MSGIGGTREPKFIQESTPRINAANHYVPNGFRGGKVLTPVAGNEFFTHVLQTTVIGTPIPLASLVSGQVPVIMGIRAAFNSGSDIITIRTSTGVIIFTVQNSYIGKVEFNFAPLGLCVQNVEHGLEALQSSGVVAGFNCSIWGYYSLVP